MAEMSEINKPKGSVYLDALWLEVEYEPSVAEAMEGKEEKNFELNLISGKKDFKLDEEPKFELKYQRKLKKNLLEQVTDGIVDIFQDDYENIKIKVQVFGPDGEEIEYDTPEGFVPQISYQKEGKFKVDLPKPKYNYSFFKPGKYRLVFEISDGDKIVTEEKDFTWGVLAINVNKSIYLKGEQAYLQMAVLDDEGDTICDANLQLEIKESKGGLFGSSEVTILSTKDGSIQYSGKCGANNITDVPDYFAYYQVDGLGKYEMKLTNLDIPGHEITDYFEVKKSVPFEVERIGPTRIYPPATYEMKIKVKANSDFKGEIIETVPFTFAITDPDGGILPNLKSENMPEIIDEEELKKPREKFIRHEADRNTYTKTIGWEVDLKAGDIYEIKYIFDAPDISPYLYLLGPLELRPASAPTSRSFVEARSWQIAADVETEVWITYDTAPSGSCADYCWTVPVDWNDASNSVEVIGGGGGGGDANGAGAGGGGAGAYSKVSNLTLSGNITFGIGASGSGGASTANGTDGGDTWFNATSLANCVTVGSTVCVGAEGGNGGVAADPWTGGAGGLATNGVGTTKADGGAGGLGCAGDGAGGGGGAGGPNGDGAGNVGGIGTGDTSPGLGGGGGGGGGGGNGAVGTIGGVLQTCAANTTGTNVGGVGGTNYAGGGAGAGGDLTGGAGSAGGGGGGGDDGGAGGNGGAGTDWTASYGSGGGGGGGGDGFTGAAGGKYGGGGGGGEACTAAGCTGAGGLIHIAYTPAAKTLSGNCKLADQSTNCSCTGCLKVARNGTLDTGTAVNIDASGTFTYTFATAPSTNDIITVFKDGVADANEAVGIVKYVGTGNITSVQLFEQHITIEQDDAGVTITNTNLSSYDNSISTDEDIFFDVNGTGLNSCTTTGCSQDIEIYIESGMTYTPGGNVETDSMEIAGSTFTLEANIASMSGSFDNDGILTANTGTVFFTATSSAETIDADGTGAEAFYNLSFGDTSSGSATWTLSTLLDVDSALNINAGTLAMNSNNINVAGNFAINSDYGNYTKGGGTFTFDGTGTSTWTDSRAAKAEMGTVSINGTTKKITLGSSVKVNELTIAALQTLDLGDSGYTLTISGDGQGAGRPFQKSGTFDVGSDSKVEYIASQSTDIEATGYHDLKLASASTNFYSYNNTTASGSFNIAEGAFDANDDVWTLGGAGTGVNKPFTVSGTFTPNTSTFNYTGDGDTTVSSGSYYNLQIGNATTQTGARTYTLDGNATVTNVLTLGPSSGSNTHILDASSYTITLSGSTTPFVKNTYGAFTTSTGTVVYQGTAATTVAALNGTSHYYNLNVGLASDTNTFSFTAGGEIEASGSVSLIAGSSGVHTFDMGSNNLSVGGGAASTGGIAVPTGTVFTQTSGTTKVYSASGSATIGGAGTTTFYNFTVGNASDGATYTFNLGGEIGASNSFTLSTGGAGTHALGLSSYEFGVWGNWTMGGATASLSAQTGLLTFSGAGNTTYTLNSGLSEPYNLTINKIGDDANDNVTLASALTVRNTLTITDGQLIQNNAYDVRVEGSTAVVIASGIDKEWTNIGTGDLTLGGSFDNAGSVSFDTNDTGCTDIADGIQILSTSNGVQRTWSGTTGTFYMYNVYVQDMTRSASPNITVYVGSSSNVTGNWTFASCAHTPVIGEVSLNSKTTPIILLESGQVDILASASITDSNGCSDISGVKAIAYRYPTYTASCSLNYNNCYDEDQFTCFADGACVGNTQPYNCYASSSSSGMWYFADPTTTNASLSYANDQWVVTIIASDSLGDDVPSNSYDDNNDPVVDVEVLLALDASTSINYGEVLPGNNTASPIEAGIKNTGNWGIDTKISGTAKPTYSSYDIDYPNQKYASVSVDYSDAYNKTLSNTDSPFNVTIPKPTSNNPGANDIQIFWGIGIPGAQPAGQYQNGQNTFTVTSDGTDL